MNILLGVGNELRGDDGIGVFVAKHFYAEGWKAIDCGMLPENYSSVVRKERPELLVIVDATDMGLEPGSIRAIPKEKIGGLALSTHSMPLSLLIDLLEPHCGKVVLVGIQPKTIADTVGLSPEAQQAAEKAIEKLKSSAFFPPLT